MNSTFRTKTSNFQWHGILNGKSFPSFIGIVEKRDKTKVSVFFLWGRLRICSQDLFYLFAIFSQSITNNKRVAFVHRVKVPANFEQPRTWSTIFSACLAYKQTYIISVVCDSGNNNICRAHPKRYQNQLCLQSIRGLIWKVTS